MGGPTWLRHPGRYRAVGVSSLETSAKKQITRHRMSETPRLSIEHPAELPEQFQLVVNVLLDDPANLCRARGLVPSLRVLGRLNIGSLSLSHAHRVSVVRRRPKLAPVPLSVCTVSDMQRKIWPTFQGQFGSTRRPYCFYSRSRHAQIVLDHGRDPGLRYVHRHRPGRAFGRRHERIGGPTTRSSTSPMAPYYENAPQFSGFSSGSYPGDQCDHCRGSGGNWHFQLSYWLSKCYQYKHESYAETHRKFSHGSYYSNCYPLFGPRYGFYDTCWRRLPEDCRCPISLPPRKSKLENRPAARRTTGSRRAIAGRIRLPAR